MSTMRRNERESCKAFLKRLLKENREFYESDRGKGALKDLQQKFPHVWLYVAELIQNAVDEKATVIRLEIVNDKTIVLEHNGKAFDYDKDVIGLCTKGVSPKGAGTVGFMGVGFKAVFRSYETVRISSGDWKFYLKVDVSIGKEYGDQHRNWLGAVLPVWDNSISAPSEGMTCRFELTDRVVENHTIESDLEAVFKDDKALLPLLARQNIQELDWNGIKWILSVDQTVPFKDATGNRLHICALSDASNETFSWIIISQEYTPSRDAIRKFLEHRQLSALISEEEKKIYSDASRIRKVEAFFQIDEDLFPILPDMGEAYALLPTSVKLPIGINILADWLLTQSRQEFMDTDLKDNPWHREIIENIPKITKHYFEWIVGDDGPSSGTWENAYKILPEVDKSAIDLFGWFLGNGDSNVETKKLEYCKLLFDELRDSEFIARQPDYEIKFISPEIARVLPEKLSKHCGDNLELIPWILFGENIASRSLIGTKAVNTLTSIGLLKEIKTHELSEYWKSGVVKSWYENFAEEVRDQRLEALLQGLFEMDEREDWKNAHLDCLPSENGEFIDRHSAVRYPGAWNIIVGNQDFVSALKPLIEKQGSIISWNFDRTVTTRQQHLRTKAKEYLETINQAKLSIIATSWWKSLEENDDFDTDLIAKFTAYICEKFPQSKELIKKVICINDDRKEVVCGLDEALLAEPYARDYRKSFFPEYSTVSMCYYNSNEALNWRVFFESCDPPTIGRFIPTISHTKLTAEKFKQIYNLQPPDLRATSIDDIAWPKNQSVKVDNKFYHLIDFKFNNSINEKLQSGIIDRYFGEWLNEGSGHLRIYLHKYLIYIPYGSGTIREVKQDETANWIQQLINCKWIYSKISNDGPYKPEDVLKSHDPVRPNAPVADLSHDLIQLLESVSINFGTQIPKAGPMQKLQIQGEYLSPSELSDVIGEILDGEDSEDIAPLIRMLETKSLIPVPAGTNLLDNSKRLPFSRIVKNVGPGFRSNLGWVIAVSDLKSDPSIVRIFEQLEDLYKFPPKTTANQAIDFLEWVWGQKPDAESVRRFLPFAYAYINEEIAQDDEIKTRWERALAKAVVYTLGRQWVVVNGAKTIYFDDLQITEYKIIQKQQMVTPSHLASSDRSDLQQAAARLLGIPILSDDYQIIAEEGASLATSVSLSQYFIEIQKVVIEFLKISENFDDPYEGADVNEESDKKQNLGLKSLASLSQKIIRLSDNKALYTKQVNAIQKGNDVLVCGEPTDFSSELCNLLISYYNANRKKNISILASEITRLLICIDRPNFTARLDKFKNKYGIETFDQKLPPFTESLIESIKDAKHEGDVEETQSNSTESAENEESNSNGGDRGEQFSESNKQSSGETKSGQTAKTNAHPTDSNISRNESDNRKVSNQTGNNSGHEATSSGSEDTPPIKPGHGKSQSSSGHNKAVKKANRLLSYVTGERTTSDDGYEILDDESHENIVIGMAAESFVMGFERDRGWEPKNMNEMSKNHQGYDIESTSPDGRLTYIEVKGINGPWTNVGVGLSAMQFKYASKYQEDYFLYVVENALFTEDSKVYRINNPAQQVTKFQFDHGWKNVALVDTESVEQPEIKT